MKKLMVFIIAFAMLFATAAVASAESTASLGYDSSYDAEKGVVTVSVYIENAIGVQAVDLNLGFDEAMYKFNDYDTCDIEDGMIFAAYIDRIPGLATCSLIFTEECMASDVDAQGRLQLVTFTFEPVDENYDINEFYLWTSCFTVDDVDICEDISGVGNDTLQEDKTEIVTSPPQNNNGETTRKTTQGIGGKLGSKWYVYVIAGALAIGAIAGIAMVSIKSSHEDDEEASEKEDDSAQADKE